MLFISQSWKVSTIALSKGVIDILKVSSRNDMQNLFKFDLEARCGGSLTSVVTVPGS